MCARCCKRNNWLDCIKPWRKLIKIMRQKEDYTDDQIDSFHVLCEAFFTKWVALQKNNGVGNSVCMIGSRYISYYQQKWRNLYKYSQQGRGD